MYLAEDRILCWELVAKRGSAWILHYQRSAYAVTVSPPLYPTFTFALPIMASTFF